MVQVNLIILTDVQVKCPYCRLVRTVKGWHGEDTFPCQDCRAKLRRLAHIEQGEGKP